MTTPAMLSDEEETFAVKESFAKFNLMISVVQVVSWMAEVLVLLLTLN